jgi:hypothetical protein
MKQNLPDVVLGVARAKRQPAPGAHLYSTHADKNDKIWPVKCTRAPSYVSTRTPCNSRNMCCPSPTTSIGNPGSAIRPTGHVLPHHHEIEADRQAAEGAQLRELVIYPADADQHEDPGPRHAYSSLVRRQSRHAPAVRTMPRRAPCPHRHRAPFQALQEQGQPASRGA